jgi:Rrf2 family transcriptional regulator, cysteine metabolism repressor
VKVSAKGEYAIRAMLDLAMHDGESLSPIQDIASRQHIPQRYLEQVLLQLKRGGLLLSKRGSAGGYRLARAADRITVGDVLRAVEGPPPGIETSRRAGRGGAEDPASDLADLWRQVAEAVAAVVDQMTLDDLRRRVEDRRTAARPMYHI